ncbi:DUF6907 domain-containing protein [Solicola sp. PLA-1-18]|uniref:DUF6907 domain-containing protein n=1 Tax=Solicola sp. PLA-1-18 TaxID=3380532 RepID=UPI003B76C2A4
MTNRDDYRHPAWCTHDEFELDGHPDDALVRHLGDEVRVKTVRNTAITAQIRWVEYFNIRETHGPDVQLEGDDGSGSMGVDEFEAGDVLSVGSVLVDLGTQIQTAGWWIQGPETAA